MFVGYRINFRYPFSFLTTMATKAKGTGSRKFIGSPEEMWELFESYREKIKSEPYKEQNWVGKEGREVEKKQMKFPTWMGFEGYLADLNKLQRLRDYKTNKDGRYNKYAPVIARIDAVCKGETVTGAISGVANHNLVARIFGISEKTENETTLVVEQVTGVRIVK